MTICSGIGGTKKVMTLTKYVFYRVYRVVMNKERGGVEDAMSIWRGGGATPRTKVGTELRFRQ